MESIDKWAKEAITVLIIVIVWVVAMMTVTAIHEMREPQYCPNCGSVIEGE